MQHLLSCSFFDLLYNDLNIFHSFPDQATPLKFKNNSRIILGSKVEKFN